MRTAFKRHGAQVFSVARLGKPSGLCGSLKFSWLVETRHYLTAGMQVALREASGVRCVVLEALDIQRSALKLQGCASREQAQTFTGGVLELPITALLPLPPGEYYWDELIGHTVKSEAGESLGLVKALVSTPAHDLLVVEHQGRERLIPFVEGETILRVAGSEIIVAWALDF